MRIDVTGGLDPAAIARLRRAIDALGGNEVLIGIPSDKSGRSDEPFGNAEIAYVQENGSPVNNIPARPFLAPGVEACMPEAIDLLEEAAREALRGETQAVKGRLTAIGMRAVEYVRGVFANNDWEPLKQSTLDARSRKQLGAEKIAQLREQGEDIPPPTRNKILQYTRQMIRAITHVVRTKGR